MAKNIKVLHYGLSNNLGGIEKVVLSWLKNKPENVSFDFAFEDTDSLLYKDELDKANPKCNIYKVTNRYSNIWQYYKDLLRIIKDNNYDYVHYHVMTMNDPIPAIIVNKLDDCKIIFHCHSMYKDYKFSIKERLLQLISKLYLLNKKYLKLACSSDAGKLMFKDNYGVIENGINISKYSFSENIRNEIRGKWGIDGHKMVIGHVGHICVEKNYPFIFSTFSKVVRENNNCVLMLIGNVNQSDSILKMVKEFGVEKNVIFTGLVDNVNEYYSAMDLFYLPSINEGFPVVLVEAQANGLPCVVSKTITKDVMLSDNVYFINLNEDEAVNIINETLNKKHERHSTIDNRYDSKHSSAKLFKFYLDNLL